MSDVQKTIYDRIVKEFKHLDTFYTVGVVIGLAWALKQAVEAESVNRTGCAKFDIKEETE